MGTLKNSHITGEKEKKPYTKPTLKEFGDIRDITKTTQGGVESDYGNIGYIQIPVS